MTIFLGQFHVISLLLMAQIENKKCDPDNAQRQGWRMQKNPGELFICGKGLQQKISSHDGLQNVSCFLCVILDYFSVEFYGRLQGTLSNNFDFLFLKAQKMTAICTRKTDISSVIIEALQTWRLVICSFKTKAEKQKRSFDS